MNLNFAAIPPVLRRVIVIAILLTAAIAAGSFALSFSAQRSWANQTGLWSQGLSWIFPGLIDAFLIVAELVLVVAAVFLASRALPLFLLAVCAAGSVLFNLAHVPPGAGWQVKLTAGVPPLAMIGSTMLIAYVVKLVMTALGKPLTYAPAAPGPVTGVLGPMPGTIYRPDYPAPGYAAGYGLPHPSAATPYPLPGAYAQLPGRGAPGAFAQEQLSTPGANPQEHLSTNGQSGRPGDEAQTSTYGLAAREVIDYLDALAERGELNASVTARHVAEETGAHYNTVRPILADYKRMLGIPTGRNARLARNGGDPDPAADT